METPFKWSASPGSDIWKQPPSTDVFTAPFTTHSKKPLKKFISATLTFRTKYIHQYDQACLLLVFTNPNSPHAPQWADWSVEKVGPENEAGVRNGEKCVTVKVQKVQDALGLCMWTYRVDEDGDKTPLRQTNWVYGDNGGEGWDLEVAAAVARPDPKKEIKEDLEVTFEKFEVEWDETA
ncbi:Protein of unknown function DUF1349 [Fusarium oxysporum f. sp. vasinfectum]|nr:Protein of unknown function DUF1349 [Fusarium oxysporum f. sp. vasinfectum]KAK2927173.1 Protein of unknown function DUF1349 [Fusarium oxysporum f. sp. vasinfectum]